MSENFFSKSAEIFIFSIAVYLLKNSSRHPKCIFDGPGEILCSMVKNVIYFCQFKSNSPFFFNLMELMFGFGQKLQLTLLHVNFIQCFLRSCNRLFIKTKKSALAFCPDRSKMPQKQLEITSLGFQIYVFSKLLA